ncbi:MAG: aldo/keto reductase, partial [Pseudomonadales bacterium]|nr:aldo/keto reductase [Pseudomonadales bacterium]
EEIWQAMEQLIRQGKITYVGSSNFPGWAIARANEKASVRHQLGLISEQSLYNLIERRAELEVLPACRAYGLGLIPWSPLAGGLLAGQEESTRGRRQSDGIRAARAERTDQLAQFQQLCDGLGKSPGVVALAWLLQQPGVCATIIGPGSLSQLTSVLHVPEVQLSIGDLQRLDGIFPPCGEAPEAYAW